MRDRDTRAGRKIRVLVVDDSALVRQVLTEVLETDPSLSVMATATDPYVAVKYIQKEVPDVIVLDVEMPRMDGLTFLEKIMSQHPIPVVICSTLSEEGSDVALTALEKGAVEIITKPRLGAKEFLEESRLSICDAVKSASQARMPRSGGRGRPAAPMAVTPKLTADAVVPKPSPRVRFQTTDQVVVVGASTGGTEALRELLSGLPPNAPGVVVVQHMPERFTRQFASRLDGLCRISVKEAEDGDPVARGQALIAPGNRHLLLRRSGMRYLVQTKEGPLVCRHRPSVDVLFRSAARCAGSNAIGVLLTGIGDDGARGMVELKESGAFNLAQDEASCVVFGMPAEAIRLGGVDRVIPLKQVAQELVRLAG
ncbi:MAG TPA: chemotaxis response regulator protein-glutamate methylesterase [Armatimonadota bacterium]